MLMGSFVSLAGMASRNFEAVTKEIEELLPGQHGNQISVGSVSSAVGISQRSGSVLGIGSRCITVVLSACAGLLPCQTEAVFRRHLRRKGKQLDYWDIWA